MIHQDSHTTNLLPQARCYFGIIILQPHLHVRDQRPGEVLNPAVTHMMLMDSQLFNQTLLLVIGRTEPTSDRGEDHFAVDWLVSVPGDQDLIHAEEGNHHIM